MKTKPDLTLKEVEEILDICKRNIGTANGDSILVSDCIAGALIEASSPQKSESEEMELKLCSQCNTMKNIADGNVCARCVREKSAPNPDVTKAEEMDWEVGFDEVYYDTDSKTRVSGFWDEHNKQCKDFIREVRATAVKEAYERGKADEKINTGKIKKRQYEQGMMHERKRIVGIVTEMPSDWESRVSVKDVVKLIQQK